MVDNSKYHILVLDPNLQAALRYCLFNWMQQRILYHIGLLELNPLNDDFDITSEKVMNIIGRYESLSCEFPFVRDGIMSGYSKLFYYDESSFDIMIRAVRMYNSETAKLVLGGHKADRVDKSMYSLSKLVEESCNFTFTMMELKKVMT